MGGLPWILEKLGFPDGSTTSQIFVRASELNLELCSTK